MGSIHKTPIWLDCDPGHDDVFAILLAAEHPSFDLLGISTVHGNASLTNVTTNALSLLTAIGRPTIPVYSGAAKPFMRPAVHAPAIHGESGIEGTSLLPTPAAAAQEGNAVYAMYEAIMKTPLGSCVLVATGTLTNVALLFATFPEVVAHVKEVGIMGGAFGEREDSRGNITKTAEFNIYCDPESAQSIFSNPHLSRRISLIPLDLTHTVLATSSVRARLLSRPPSAPPNSHLRRMLHDLLTYFSSTYERVFGITAGPPLHDPLAVAVLLPTDEIRWEVEEVQVDVVTAGVEVGRTVKVRASGEGVGGKGGEGGKGEAEEGVKGAGMPGEEKRGEELGQGGERVKTLVKVPKWVDVEAFWDVVLRAVESAEGRYVWEE